MTREMTASRLTMHMDNEQPIRTGPIDPDMRCMIRFCQSGGVSNSWNTRTDLGKPPSLLKHTVRVGSIPDASFIHASQR